MGKFLSSLRFHEVLKALTDCDEGKLHILRVLYEFWKNHPLVGSFRLHIFLSYCMSFVASVEAHVVNVLFQMISVLVDKFIRTQIVDCAAVANWVFSPEMAHDFTRYTSEHTQTHLHVQVRRLQLELIYLHWASAGFMCGRFFIQPSGR